MQASTWILLSLLLAEMPSVNYDSGLCQFRKLIPELSTWNVFLCCFIKSQLSTTLLAGLPKTLHVGLWSRHLLESNSRENVHLCGLVCVTEFSFPDNSKQCGLLPVLTIKKRKKNPGRQFKSQARKQVYSKFLQRLLLPSSDCPSFFPLNFHTVHIF